MKGNTFAILFVWRGKLNNSNKYLNWYTRVTVNTQRVYVAIIKRLYVLVDGDVLGQKTIVLSHIGISMERIIHTPPSLHL